MVRRFITKHPSEYISIRKITCLVAVAVLEELKPNDLKQAVICGLIDYIVVLRVIVL
jgi:hypothetical protein